MWYMIESSLPAKLLQLCLTLCHAMDWSSPGSSVHGIFQARILKWVAISTPGDLPDPGIEPKLLLLLLQQADSLPLSHLESPFILLPLLVRDSCLLQTSSCFQMLLTVLLCFCFFSIHVAERRELGEFTVIHALTGWLPEVISLQYV